MQDDFAHQHQTMGLDDVRVSPDLVRVIRIAAGSMLEPEHQMPERRGLSDRELEALKRSGFDPHKRAIPDPQAMTILRYALIIMSSLSVEQVATNLRCKPERVKRMMSKQEIYSFCVGDGCYIPSFQFEGNGLIRGISRVNQAIPSGLHPVAVHNWYHLPNTDLCLENDIDRTVSPLAWLRVGGDIKRAVFLAENL